MPWTRAEVPLMTTFKMPAPSCKRPPKVEPAPVLVAVPRLIVARADVPAPLLVIVPVPRSAPIATCG